MTRHFYRNFAFILLAGFVPAATAHAATITDEFTITGSNFQTISNSPDPVPFSSFTTTFDVTFDPTQNVFPGTSNGFTLKSASAGFDPNYYGFQYVNAGSANAALLVGGPDPRYSIIGSNNHFDLELVSPNLNNVDYLRYITADGAQFEAGDSSVSVSQVADVSAVPLPPALPMFAAAFLALGAFAWRRAKPSQAV